MTDLDDLLAQEALAPENLAAMDSGSIAAHRRQLMDVIHDTRRPAAERDRAIAARRALTAEALRRQAEQQPADSNALSPLGGWAGGGVGDGAPFSADAHETGPSAPRAFGGDEGDGGDGDAGNDDGRLTDALGRPLSADALADLRRALGVGSGSGGDGGDGDG